MQTRNFGPRSGKSFGILLRHLGEMLRYARKIDFQTSRGPSLPSVHGTMPKTGRGPESIHPRWFSWLSPQLLDLFAGLMVALEAAGMWPEQIRLMLIALIPKQDGGRQADRAVTRFRPIVGGGSQPTRSSLAGHDDQIVQLGSQRAFRPGRRLESSPRVRGSHSERRRVRLESHGPR